MLTIFSTPKPFKGHIKTIQTNAFQSWVSLRPACEVILFGDEEGSAEVAAELGIRHIPEVGCNEYGTPLISSMFEIAQDVASYQLMCYVNADIILMSDFLLAIRQIQWQSFLLVGQRWDVDIKDLLDFSKLDWQEQLRTRLAKEGNLHAPSGLDYFVFSHGMYRDIPPFAIGRPGWDNWMVYWARSLKVPVIDATRVITAIHQNHDYSHHPEGKAGVWEGPEAERNRELLGGDYYAFGLLDAPYRLTPTGLKSTMTMSPRYLAHRTLRLPEMHPHWIPLVQIIKILRYLYFSLRSRAAVLKRSMQKHRLPDTS